MDSTGYTAQNFMDNVKLRGRCPSSGLIPSVSAGNEERH